MLATMSQISTSTSLGGVGGANATSGTASITSTTCNLSSISGSGVQGSSHFSLAEASSLFNSSSSSNGGGGSSGLPPGLERGPGNAELDLDVVFNDNAMASAMAAAGAAINAAAANGAGHMNPVTASNSDPANLSPPGSAANGMVTVSGQHQQEKTSHYNYLKDFRVNQCPHFLQHKCTQHKPFTCFNWHFMNQRRRRPMKKRDGTFNYSPDVYCTKYDETTGICPEGDDCPYLHRTAGDTERRYHLRYYKTGMCVYDTDTRGHCVKNGAHCAFAHGPVDLRAPVLDIRETQEGGAELGSSLDGTTSTSLHGGGLNSLDKERNALNEDPRWNDTAYVLANYKTELCKRPPRLCRQGYACPQYHNNKDRRRTPKKYKYRSTPCPNVKQGDEWGDPANCESGDGCAYCHTRTEQQFHPEIYKSTKCNDIMQTGYCPRGAFCAFAHVEHEDVTARELATMDPTSVEFANLLANTLNSAVGVGGGGGGPGSGPIPNPSTAPVPITKSMGLGNAGKLMSSQTGLGMMVGPGGDGHHHGPLPPPSHHATHHGHHHMTGGLPGGVNNPLSVASSLPGDLFSAMDFSIPLHQQQEMLQRQLSHRVSVPGVPHGGTGAGGAGGKDQGSLSGMNAALGPIARPRSYSTSATGAVDRHHQHPFGNLSSLAEHRSGLLAGRLQKTEQQFSTIYGSQNGSILGSSVGSTLPYYASETVESVVGSALNLDDVHLEDLHLVDSATGGDGCEGLGEGEGGVGGGSQSAAAAAAASLVARASLIASTPPVNIPGSRMQATMSGLTGTSPIGQSPRTSSFSGAFAPNPQHQQQQQGNSFFDISGLNPNLSPNGNTNLGNNPAGDSQSVTTLNSLIEMQRYREEMQQARGNCDLWQRQAEESVRREKLIEQQRDEAFSRINHLQQEMESLNGLNSLLRATSTSEWESLPVGQLQQIHSQLKMCMEKIENILSNRANMIM